MIARAVLFAMLGLFIGVWACWVVFGCVMNLKRVRDAGELTKPAEFFGIITLMVGYVLDLGLNIVVGTMLFLEPPREPLFSTRLQRLTDTSPNTWRGRFALWLRRSLLDNIDPAGVHRG